MGAEYREVDHHGPASEAVHSVRSMIGFNLNAILYLLHEEQPLTAGEQWTLPVSMSCGFKGDIIVRVEQTGTCKPKEGM